METTGKTFEATIPEQSTSATLKTGLDEALEDIKTGRVYHAESVEDMFNQILG